MEVQQTCNQAKFRGKLYSLSHESAWEEAGTGFVSVIGPEDCRRLIFKAESGDILHDRPVFCGDTYQLQGEGERQTIIVWEDPETDKDWALSFQDSDGTVEIWEALADAEAEDRRLLPLPRLGALADCSRLLTFVPPVQREILASECLSSKFLATLRESFHTVEGLGDEEALSQIWQIIKGALFLSSQKLTERLLGADAYEDVLGMLEYDDGLPKSKRIAHRQVMKEKVCFSQVLSFEDSAMLERVHLNYRLQYLKDIVLPRLMDDATFISLNQMVHLNLSVILDYLRQSTHLLDRLFQQIRQKDLQSLLFLQDACRLAKQIPPVERLALHEKMVECSLFEVLAAFLTDGPVTGKSTLDPRQCAVEVLLLSASTDPAPLRLFLTRSDDGGGTHGEGRALLSAIVRLMLFDDDQGVQGQLSELLRAVMDPTGLEAQERDQCLDAFYERGGLDEIVAPLRLEAEHSSETQGAISSFGRQIVCELLTFAVTHHGDRSKTYVIRHGIARHAARIMASPQRFLQLAPIRLIKAMVVSRDDAYHQDLAQSGLFVPLFWNFQVSLQPPALGGNLVVSATLELLELIRIENITILVEHICGPELGPIVREHAPRFKTLEGLLLRHAQASERPVAGADAGFRLARDSSDTDIEGAEQSGGTSEEAARGSPEALPASSEGACERLSVPAGEPSAAGVDACADASADDTSEPSREGGIVEGEEAEREELDAKMAQTFNHVAKKLRMCASVQA